ncbi:response regulator transcription factor [Silanimonas sp.]|jgi:two-component system response regulator RegA|uniref:response regulator transcription factor n=1 Tax=Silanimonas sp. TaxID=1929290 RepID=UPI0037C8E5E2
MTTLPVLLIDDDAAFASVLARALERRGQPCRHAADAASALQQAREPLSGIVLDLKLGADNGLALIEPLRGLQPDVPILLLTGYASIATAVEAIKRGATDYRPKPVSADDVLRALFGPEDGNEGEDELPTPADGPLHPKRLEWEHLQRVLAEHDSNVSSAARALGLHRRSLQRKLAKKPLPERASGE